jgi:glycosyltransferase involved in cell wall biosynthesis
MKVKEVTVFTSGDSTKLSTWSNVPFLFTKALLENNIIVNRVDVSANNFLKKLYDATVQKVIKAFSKNTSYDYYRSLVHYYNLKARIKKGLKKYKNADANIFFAFGFPTAGLSNTINIQFGDWTFDYYLKVILNKKPDFFEQKYISRENYQITCADLVFPLFPGVKKHLEDKNILNKIHYLGNVINTVIESKELEILSLKENSFNILFAGSYKYIDGANSLIQAFEQLKNTIPNLQLHIIGMDTSNFSKLPQNVFCYGYLDKDNPDQQALYYTLFKQAKVFINTTPKWAGFSATIEAMYFYTPVIVSPYNEFIETFGTELDFGFYCNDNTPEKIQVEIRKIFNHQDYKTLCTNAHKAVHHFTWGNYIEKMINIAEGYSQKKIVQ